MPEKRIPQSRFEEPEGLARVGKHYLLFNFHKAIFVCKCLLFDKRFQVYVNTEQIMVVIQDVFAILLMELWGNKSLIKT